MVALKFVLALVCLAAVGGCGGGDDGPPTSTGETGNVSGQVVVSGALRSARVLVEQIDLETGAVRDAVGEVTTDAEGRFSLDTGTANGLLLLTASGGSFTDVATGATIELDIADEIRSYAWVELLETRDDVLVSPIGELIVARTGFKLASLDNITEAQDDAAEHLNRHFGNADWTRLKLVGLDQPAASPTENVRAALVQASLSFLAQDIALAAGASPQEVNVYTLTQAWAQDIATGAFDGNDGNDRLHGTGLQVGACPAIDPACAVPGTGCTTGSCRALCDVYVGTPRALLGGIMTKVIRNPDINKTGLNVNDTLAIARSVSDNIDEDLFGGACIETLDRLPPTLLWTASPAESAYVRAAITLQATAVDDLDPNPRTTIADHPDSDGDPSNASAIATINTAQVTDGAYSVTATTVDIAGNTASITRSLTVDNTAPVVTLASTGYFVDGATWWTVAAMPVLGGMVADTSPVTIKAVVNGVDTTGTVTGNTFSVALPAGTIDLAGREVTIIATDAAGNQKSVLQRLRHDPTPPQLGLQNALVLDEASEVPAFTSNTAANETERPRHVHTGTAINLDVSPACPTVTKFSYLLGAQTPNYVFELDGDNAIRRNPILYPLLAGDDGVGIAANTTQYRVVYRPTNTVVRDWIAAGPGAPIAPGTLRHDVGIYSGVVSGLATTEGIYDVQLRASDRLGRTSTVARCFDLKLKAPPLHFTTGGVSAGSDLALNALVLGAPGSGQYNAIAARLLSATASGASLIDQRFINGTAETVYLTVDVTPFGGVSFERMFVRRNARTSRAGTNVNCDVDPSLCDTPTVGPTYQSPVESGAVVPRYPVKVYETTAAGALMSEIPCIAPCPSSGMSFRFAIPPRPFPLPFGGPPRYFVAMTMITAVPALAPSDDTHTSIGPFVDTTLTNISSTGTTQTVPITGKVDSSSSGCTKYAFPNGVFTCIERSTVRSYRALVSVSLKLAGVAEMDLKTAASLTSTAIGQGPIARAPATWSASLPETSLPNFVVNPN